MHKNSRKAWAKIVYDMQVDVTLSEIWQIAIPANWLQRDWLLLFFVWCRPYCTCSYRLILNVTFLHSYRY